MNTKHGVAMVAFGLSVAITNCASGKQTVQMTTTPSIPAAQGTVNASAKTENDNTALEVDVRHLAPPARVAPGATTYVVWASPLGQDAPQNIGALRVDQDLRGILTTVTPLHGFDVFITAEPSPTVTTPTGARLLSASVHPRTG